MINFGIWDYGLMGLYFAGVLWIGFRTKINDKSHIDYLVAGRNITLPAFVATLVSSFYGGILGVGEFTYNFGVSAWFLYAFPYYFFIIIFALFLAGRIRKTKLFTIPDKLETTYGRNVGVFGAMMVFLLVTPAPYVFMLGILTQLIFGFNLITSMLFCLVVSVVFLYKGGLIADVRVNIFEFIMMFAGFGIILPFAVLKLGGLGYLQANLPAQHTTLTGGNSMMYIMAWFFMGAWALVDPGFHQRCYAAKSENVARKGVFISLGFWFLFDFMTTVSGLYAVARIKGLENPAMSYPLLANEILPQAAKGFFFIGLLATIMSTMHSYLFISATTLGRDIIGRIKRKEHQTRMDTNFTKNKNEEQEQEQLPLIPRLKNYFRIRAKNEGHEHQTRMNTNFTKNKIEEQDEGNKYTKIGIVVTSVLSLGIAILLPSVVKMWYVIGSTTIPALLIGLISSYFPRAQAKSIWILSAMIVSFLFSILWVIFKIGYIEPFFVGVISGGIIYLIGLIKKYWFIK